jgi:drug/metabolite transporter (DMT)-like permease
MDVVDAGRAVSPVRSRSWLTYALFTTLAWGVWGAFSDLPAQHGFPDTLTYVVWSLTMILPAAWTLRRTGWKVRHDARSLALGMAIGLTGAGGQLILFHALTIGPTYLIFPIISLSPVITIVLSFLLLGERTGRLGQLGIVLAVASLPFLNDWAPDAAGAASLGLWFLLAVGILVAWGLQGYFIKLAHATMDTESIFFYMMLTGLMLAPVALWLTDFHRDIYLGFSGPYLAAATQILNAVGALTLVYALRDGKAIVVSPLTNAGAPLLTAVIAMVVAGAMPGPYKIAGIALSFIASLLLALQPEDAGAGAEAGVR